MTPPAALALIVEGLQQDPLQFLGRHTSLRGVYIRIFNPSARHVALVDTYGRHQAMDRWHDTALFEWRGDGALIPKHPMVHWCDSDARTHIHRDAYSFAPAAAHQLTSVKNHQVTSRWHASLGAHPRRIDNIAGIQFSAWAPGARSVGVVGEFNDWVSGSLPMARCGQSAVWTLFMPGVRSGTSYDFEIDHQPGALTQIKRYSQATRTIRGSQGTEHPP
jgi:1,4-alpha-glucan branching enzyme